ncbi:MAG: hypothetical protein JXR37_16530 [Kiritimatiellae bacterium]|nr:hypothetical protein [Kiritimatiellia bacterium]
MKTFLGIGCGPIQTGIFLTFASESEAIGRIVVSEVDAELVAAVRAASAAAVNVASTGGVEACTIPGIEILNPTAAADADVLAGIAAESDEIATALPSVAFYRHIAPLLADGFDRAPDRPRLVYTAENNNTAAEQLKAAVGQAAGRQHPNTRYLNTVVGKMSRVVTGAELDACRLRPLAPALARAHLVEAFDQIYISDTGGAERALGRLIEKKDLLPFEEAKLYGHNAIHALIGFLACEKGMTYLFEAGGDAEIMAHAKDAFLAESGAALCGKWAGTDDLFTEQGFGRYALDLLARMTNPHLRDTVARICRDPARKLGWDDRLIGTMRLALAQGIAPKRMARAARIAATIVSDSTAAGDLRRTFAGLWPEPWGDEHEAVWRLIQE